MIHWQPGLTLADIEKVAIQKAFQFYESNKTATARALGIAIRTLDYKLARYEYEDKLSRGEVTEPPAELEEPSKPEPKKKK